MGCAQNPNTNTSCNKKCGNEGREVRGIISCYVSDKKAMKCLGKVLGRFVVAWHLGLLERSRAVVGAWVVDCPVELHEGTL